MNKKILILLLTLLAFFYFISCVPKTYEVSGTITLNSNGLENVTVTLTQGTTTIGTVTTSASGDYVFTKIENGTYTVTPTLTGYTFAPETQTAEVNGDNVADLDFTATPVVSTYTISGTILYNGTGLSGVEVALTGAGTQNAITNVNGIYIFTNVANGSYTITPTLTGYTFDPATLSANVNNANVTGKDFTAYDSTVQYTLSGNIKVHATGTTFNNLSGVIVNLTGAGTQNTTTDASGNYTFTVNAGAYTVTPTLAGHTFVANDYSFNVSVLNANVVKDFSAFNNTTDTIILISALQGAQHESPMKDQVVSKVLGVVTGVNPSYGFYIQSPKPDNDVKTSEGVYVYNGAAVSGLNKGDWVFVNGTVKEYISGSYPSDVPLTEISTSPSWTVIKTGGNLIQPTLLGDGGRAIPTSIICDDAVGGTVIDASYVFDPENDGLDFFESLEGMYVQINDAVVMKDVHINYDEIFVIADDGANAGLRSLRGGILITETDRNPERILLDYTNTITGNTQTDVDVVVGDKFDGAIYGIMDYAYSYYRINLTQNFPTIVNGPLHGFQNRETTTLTGVTANKLKVASFNLENFTAGDPQSKIDDHANTIVNRLSSPDIVGLVEIQDNNGITNDGTVNCDLTMGKLLTAINALSGPAYQYVQINPVNNQDGGADGGNIRVVLMYNPARVTFNYVAPIGDPSTTAVTVSNVSGNAQLSHNPGRIDPTNVAFNQSGTDYKNSRKPLIGEFFFNGEKIFIVVNHWNSKGGDGPEYGRFQPPVLGSETQRLAQATVIKDFLNQIMAINSNSKIIVIGDLNDYQFSAPVGILLNDVTGGMKSLINDLPENERYSYVYNGNSQVLDHIVISNNLYNNYSPEFDIVRCNAEYLFGVKNSDHDPAVATLTFAPDTTPPLFVDASVNGDTLILNYNEGLDPASVPATTNFTVTVELVERGVTNVAISGNKVTLTLASAVVNGESVTVSYTVPVTNPIQDVAGNDAGALATENVLNDTPLPDTTPPVWAATYPKNDTPTSSGVTVRAQIDEAGKVYYVVLADGSTAPNPAQIKAGTDAFDGALPANRFGSITMVANTENNAAITGLTAETSYDIYFIAEDTVPNLQTVTDRKLLDITTTAEEADLFISEYIEGGSFNKAIEIYNGTGATVTLTGNYLLIQYNNGSATPSFVQNFSSGTYTIADGDVFILYHGSAVTGISSVGDLIDSSVINFNGDDAVALIKDNDHNGSYSVGDTFLDVIGQIGVDPGTQWINNGVSTLNMTLVKKPGEIRDTDGSDAFDPSVQWTAYPQDTFTYLGSHTP